MSFACHHLFRLPELGGGVWGDRVVAGCTLAFLFPKASGTAVGGADGSSKKNRRFLVSSDECGVPDYDCRVERSREKK